MTAPQEHSYSSSTPAHSDGNPGSPPLTDSTASNIDTSSSIWSGEATGPGHSEGTTQSEWQ